MPGSRRSSAGRWPSARWATPLARNPIPFVIPCHRVVRSDGRIGNYGAGGPTAKRAVLESEGMDTTELERLPAGGVRFIGSDTTHIYLLPVVPQRAPDHGPPHGDVALADEARRAGYRACKVCRPVDPPFRAA